MDACREVIYIGESFARFVLPGIGRAIADYDITVHIFTRRNGERIVADTDPAQGDIPVHYRSDNVAFFNVPAGQSARLSPGVIKIWSKLTHRPTGQITIREEIFWRAERSLLSGRP